MALPLQARCSNSSLSPEQRLPSARSDLQALTEAAQEEVAGISLHRSRFAPPLSARFPPTHPSTLSATCSRPCLLLLDPICLILSPLKWWKEGRKGRCQIKARWLHPGLFMGPWTSSSLLCKWSLLSPFASLSQCLSSTFSQNCPSSCPAPHWIPTHQPPAWSSSSCSVVHPFSSPLRYRVAPSSAPFSSPTSMDTAALCYSCKHWTSTVAPCMDKFQRTGWA